MPKVLALLALCLLCTPNAVSQTSPIDHNLMTDAEYRVFLSQVESSLPKWESALKGIDPDKIPEISYSNGKWFVDKRDVALVQISNIRLFIAQQRVKRTVYGELAIKGFLDSLFDVGEEIVWSEDFTHLSLTHLEKYAPELSALNIRLTADAMARVRLLELSLCR